MQHDLLWPELTAEAHMYLYAKLKGIPKERRKEQVNDILTRVMLPVEGDGGKVTLCTSTLSWHT